MLTSGDVIGGTYVLERQLGEGGMGEVWAATHRATGRQVALKFLKGEPQPAAVKRFLREARAASAVRHPNVVQVQEIFQLEDGLPVMVMDLLIGESMGSLLAREGALSLGRTAEILGPVVSAIGAAHAIGIVHRDLKPDNVFLVYGPDGLVPQVLDFGIAKLSATEGEAAATAHLTTTGAIMGTPFYMAPEQVFGEKDLDHRADVWSLGVILYEALAGRRPVEGDNVGQLIKAITTGAIRPLAEVAPQLPEELTELVARMLRTDRATRLSDLREVLAVLRRYAEVSAPSFGQAAPAREPVSADAPTEALSAEQSNLLRGGARTVAALPAPEGSTEARREQGDVLLGVEGDARASTTPSPARHDATGAPSARTVPESGWNAPAGGRWRLPVAGAALVLLGVGATALVVPRGVQPASAPEPSLGGPPSREPPQPESDRAVHQGPAEPVPAVTVTVRSGESSAPSASTFAPASRPAPRAATAVPRRASAAPTLPAAPAKERPRGSVVTETPF